MKQQKYCSTCEKKNNGQSEDYISIKSLHEGSINFCNIDCMFEYMKVHNEYLLIGKKMEDLNGKSSISEE